MFAHLGMYYFIIFLSFLFWCVGSYLVSLSVFCAATAPLLYSFSLFLVTMYWIGFIVIVG